MEIYVNCPLEHAWPAIQKVYIAQRRGVHRLRCPDFRPRTSLPQTPELVVECEAETPEAVARRVLALLIEKGYIR
jgi:hypothetical protein